MKNNEINEFLGFDPSKLSIYEDNNENYNVKKEDIDFLGFDPSKLRIHEKDDDEFFGVTFPKRNYPIEDYYKDDFDEVNDTYSVIAYVYNQLIKNSIESINWLSSHQNEKSSDKSNKAHESKRQQILTIEFQILLLSKMKQIVELTNKLFEKTDTYCWGLDLYKYYHKKFSEYIIGKSKNERTKRQAEWFVEGIIKIIMSGTWDYNTLSYILENEKCSFKYIFDNTKWIKMNS